LDAILFAMYALSISAEGDSYQCVPPDPGIAAAAALGASESGTLPGTAPAQVFTVLPCPAVPSSSLSGLHLPSLSTNLVSTAALHDAMVTTTTPGGQRVTICTCTRTGRQIAASCSCRLLSHQTLLWHHRLGHPSLPRHRGMHSRLLVSGLPRSLPPLPPSPAPPCLPSVEGRQRAAPHSSSFPLTTAPLQTLHMDVWGPACVSGQSRERYFLLVVDDYTRYITVFPLRSKGQVVDVLIPWIRTVRLQLRERFGHDLPVLRLHSDRGDEFSSDLLRDFCHGEGILQSFTLPGSPQRNKIAERRIGLVMEVARTSMIHAAAPHFRWPFAVWYAAHQLNLWPRVSLPETLPTLRWTGEVGDALVFRVWGSHAFVRDTSADKLSPRAIPYVFVGFVPDAPCNGILWGAEPEGAEPGGAEPGGAESGGAEIGGAESGGAEPGGAESGGAEYGGAEPGGAEPGGAEPGGAGSARVASRGTSSRRELLSPQELREWFAQRWSSASRAGGTTVVAGPGGTRIGGTGAAGTGGAAGAAGIGPAGAAGATGAGAAGGLGAGGSAGAGASEGAGVGTVGARGATGAGAAVGGTGAVPAGSGGAARPRPYFVPLLEQVLGLPPSTGPTPPLACPQPVQSQSQLQPASPLPAPSPYTGPSGGLAERREPASRPASPVHAARTSRRAPRPRPPAVSGTHQMALRPSTAPLCVPLPSPPEPSLPVLADPESDSLRAASPTVTHLLATVVTDPSFESTAASALVTELVDFATRYRLDYATSPVAESESVCPPSVGGECVLSTDVLEDRQEEFQCFAAALPHLVSMLLAPQGDPDAPDIPTPRSYAEAIEAPQWQAAMDAEMASWKSKGTYVDEVPPPGANIVNGMWIFRVKRPPGSPSVFKARYVARGFSQRQGVDYFHTFSPTPKMTTLRVLLHVAAQRDYELHSLDFSTAFLQGSLHEEIWLRRPPGFTGSFPPGTQWSLRRPVYGLRQAPREWHDTMRTTLAALGFAPSTADPSLFLRTDTSLSPFYILVYVDDLVLQRFDFTYSLPQATPLSTRHSLSALPSDESVEPSGPYPELVGCLMYLMICTRPDLAYPLSILARYVAPGRHRPEHMAAAKRVLRYLCSTSGLGLVLGGRSPVVLTGHADASWVDDLATQRSSQGYTFSLGSGSVSWRSTRSSSVLSSSCEAEIYAGAMAAQELRWLTYLLHDLGEPPRSPPVLIRTVRLQLREHFGHDLPVLRLHPDRGDEFSSDLLRDFCHGEGILPSFTLPDSPQRNKIAERRIGLVMEVARTSMIHAAAPHFLWPFAVWYAAHQLNLWPRVSLPETSPTLRWTGKVGDALVFRVWGSRAFVRDTFADKLSPCAIPCVLGFVPDAPGWQLYHPTSCRVFPSQDVMFDESVPFYRLFRYVSAPPPPLPLFLAPGPPPVDPLPPQGPAPLGVSQVDPLPSPAPVQVAVGSGAARGAASGGAASGGAEPGGAESEGAKTGGAETRGVETGGGEPGGAEPEGVEPGGAALEGAESEGVEPQGAASSGGSAGASPRLCPQQLHEWFVRRARLWSGATGAGGVGAAGDGGAGVAAGAGVTGGTTTAGPGGARTRGTRAAGTGGVEGAGAGDPTESGATNAGGSGGAGVGGPGVGGVGAGGAGVVDPGGTARPRPYFVPLLQQVLGALSSTGLTPPLLCPPPNQFQLPLQPASPLPAPSPYTEQSGGLTERHEPGSRPVSPVRTAHRVPRSRPPPVLSTHAMTLRPSFVPLGVPLPDPLESSLSEVPDPESHCRSSPRHYCHIPFV
ncbi:unnamed protein product, partial [Closterium sp. NIES-54]